MCVQTCVCVYMSTHGCHKGVKGCLKLITPLYSHSRAAKNLTLSLMKINIFLLSILGHSDLFVHGKEKFMGKLWMCACAYIRSSCVRCVCQDLEVMRLGGRWENNARLSSGRDRLCSWKKRCTSSALPSSQRVPWGASATTLTLTHFFRPKIFENSLCSFKGAPGLSLT